MDNYSTTIADRLHAGLRVEPNGCITWTRSVNMGGYGRIGRGSRGAGYAVTHRVAWELAHGPVPDDLFVLHRCDNPPCCNPDHLFLGTLSDNTQDMLSKGRARAPRGEAHGSARLSDAEVATLRTEASSVGNYAELGRRYGITKQHARALVLGEKRSPAA